MYRTLGSEIEKKNEKGEFLKIFCIFYKNFLTFVP